MDRDVWTPAANPLATAAEVRDLLRFLESQGTFHFPTLPNGLFCAAAGTHDDFEASGYQNVWVRDNVHVAHAHYVIDDRGTAARTMSSLLEFFAKQAVRMGALLEGKADSADPMNRPHIRFDGRTLSELPERWAHAQNDALGYLLWLASKLMRDGSLQPGPGGIAVLSAVVHVLKHVRYWEDEDSGHWEETRKIEASSIGTAVAGLRELRRLLDDHPAGAALRQLERRVDQELLDELIEQGESALRKILPYECIQTDPLKHRKYDSALLFLIYPLEVVTGRMAETILDNVRTHLQGDHGVRRYLGDSYWCANYRKLLSAEARTSDFSDDLSGRDSLLKPGEEAQWCIFDPIISVIHGRRYLESRSQVDLELQRLYLRRSLSELTRPDSMFGAYRCPESYFLEDGRYVPNDITPLLWTQANLRLALAWMERTLASS
jgi:hypothetical protein